MNDWKKNRPARDHDRHPDQIGKLPPQAVEVEEAVLGAVLLEEGAYHRVSDMLIPDAFYKEQNGHICTAIINLMNSGKKADILTVTQELKAMGQLEIVGGAYYISTLADRIASSANVEIHMRIVLQKYIKRMAILAATNLIKDAYEDGTDDLGVIDTWEKSLTSLTSRLFIKNAVQIGTMLPYILEHNDRLINSTDRLVGVPSGFSELDRITGGFRGGNLIVLAARPGMGKTALAIAIAAAAAKAGYPTAVFSLEQSILELSQRLCAQETDIALDKFITTGMHNEDLRKFLNTSQALFASALLIDDTGGQSLFDIRNKARRLKREKKIRMIVIDYLQLMGGPSETKMNREQEVSNISRGLKALAKELDIPIIALAQLSRQAENQSKSIDNVPKLSHLRDSGAIEQDADMVMFIYRPEYYGLTEDANGNSTKGVAKVIIAKNRSGAIDDVDLKWKGICVKFTDFNAPEVFENEPGAIITGPLPPNQNFLDQ